MLCSRARKTLVSPSQAAFCFLNDGQSFMRCPYEGLVSQEVRFWNSTTDLGFAYFLPGGDY